MKIKNIKEISVGYNGLEISGTFIDKDNEEIFLKDYGIINEDITKYVLDLQQRIDKVIKYINYMFDKANENDIIDDLLKIEKILKGSEDNE